MAKVLSVHTNLTDSKDKFQFKYLASDVTTANADITSLKFSGLEIGKKYRLTSQIGLNTSAGSTCGVYYTNGAQIICSKYQTGATNSRDSIVAVFIATATTIVASTQNVSGTVQLISSGDRSQTFASLEELPNHVETTQWT